MTRRRIMFGTITPEGALESEGPVLLPPGPVLVTIEPWVEAERPSDVKGQVAERAEADRIPPYDHS